MVVTIQIAKLHLLQWKFYAMEPALAKIHSKVIHGTAVGWDSGTDFGLGCTLWTKL